MYQSLKYIFFAKPGTLDRERFFTAIMVLILFYLCQFGMEMHGQLFFRFLSFEAMRDRSPIFQVFLPYLYLGDVAALLICFGLGRGLTKTPWRFLITLILYLGTTLPRFMSLFFNCVLQHQTQYDYSAAQMAVYRLNIQCITLGILIIFVVGCLIIGFLTPTLRSVAPDDPLIQYRDDLPNKEQLRAIGYIGRLILSTLLVIIVLLGIGYMTETYTMEADTALQLFWLVLLIWLVHFLYITNQRTKNCNMDTSVLMSSLVGLSLLSGFCSYAAISHSGSMNTTFHHVMVYNINVIQLLLYVSQTIQIVVDWLLLRLMVLPASDQPVSVFGNSK